MAGETANFLDGFLAHLVGGIIAAIVGWFAHAYYQHRQRRKMHARFDHEIEAFVGHLKALIPTTEMPGVMQRVVPLVSRATFGTEIPPLNKEYTFPAGLSVGCKMCEQSINPLPEGRCPTCKIGLQSYHNPKFADSLPART